MQRPISPHQARTSSPLPPGGELSSIWPWFSCPFATIVRHACGMMQLESLARRAWPDMARESSVPRKVFAAAGDMSVAPAREILKKRLAVELDAVHDLV